MRLDRRGRQPVDHHQRAIGLRRRPHLERAARRVVEDAPAVRSRYVLGAIARGGMQSQHLVPCVLQRAREGRVVEFAMHGVARPRMRELELEQRARRQAAAGAAEQLESGVAGTLGVLQVFAIGPQQTGP